MANKLFELTEKDIKDKLTRVAWDVLNDLADTLASVGFPLEKKISFKGATVSKVTDPKFWVEYSEDKEEYVLRYTFVPDATDKLYTSDLLSPKFLSAIVESANEAYETFVKYKEAVDWINADKPCVYRHGWAYRGAGARRITKEKALELYPKYSFDIGFYQLGWTTVDGVRALEFNEFSVLDME